MNFIRYISMSLLLLASLESQAARYALVMGNENYVVARSLSNPKADAEDIAKELARFNFQVTPLINAGKQSMEKSFSAFLTQVQAQNTPHELIVYFSGHGVQHEGANYLMPVDANPETRADIPYTMMNAQRILDNLQGVNPKGVNLLILDACRNVPSQLKSLTKSDEQGLVGMKPAGSLILYATSPSKVALGTEKLRNSIYTHHLLETLRNVTQQQSSIFDIQTLVAGKVTEETQNRQTPWQEGTLIRPFCLLPPCSGAVVQNNNQEQIVQLQAEIARLKQGQVVVAEIPATPSLVTKTPPAQAAAPNYANWRALRTLSGHSEGVLSVAFSLDGRTALSGSRDETFKLWDLVTDKEINTFSGHSDYIHSVTISPDGRTALSGSRDDTLKRWDLVTGKEIRTFNGHSNTINSVTISPDGRTALSGSDDKTLKLWSLVTGKAIYTFSGHGSSVQSVAISPDGRTALSGSYDKTLKLWSLLTGKEIRTFNGHSHSVNSVAISPDGRTALSGSADHTFKLWDLATGKEIRTFSGHSRLVSSVTISPDGRTALSGSLDKTLKLWDIATGKEILTFSGHSNGVSSVTFSPDGRRALSGSVDHTLILWGEK